MAAIGRCVVWGVSFSLLAWLLGVEMTWPIAGLVLGMVVISAIMDSLVE